jgi:hypothetical protein
MAGRVTSKPAAATKTARLIFIIVFSLNAQLIFKRLTSYARPNRLKPIPHGASHGNPMTELFASGSLAAR